MSILLILNLRKIGPLTLKKCKCRVLKKETCTYGRRVVRGR